jgi:very-short-patch-repair endonuclease
MASRLEDRFANDWRQLYPGLPFLREQTIPPWQAWADERKALGLVRRRVPYVADFVWPQAMVAVEIQGATWVQGGHSSGAGIQRDAMKAITAAAGGWVVLPLTGNMLTRDGSIWLPKVAGIIRSRLPCCVA